MTTPGPLKEGPGRFAFRGPSGRGPGADYSTVTLLARLRGWSTSFPRISATW